MATFEIRPEVAQITIPLGTEILNTVDENSNSPVTDELVYILQRAGGDLFVQSPDGQETRIENFFADILKAGPFSLDDFLVFRNGNDLVLQARGGSADNIILEDFFSFTETPSLITPDGSIWLGNDGNDIGILDHQAIPITRIFRVMDEGEDEMLDDGLIPIEEADLGNEDIPVRTASGEDEEDDPSDQVPGNADDDPEFRIPDQDDSPENQPLELNRVSINYKFQPLKLEIKFPEVERQVDPIETKPLTQTATGLRLFGNDSNEVLNGGSYNDEIRGGGGNDQLNGRGGNDDLYGEAGDDTLTGGTGNDLLDGGTDDDTADYQEATGGITVDLSRVTAQDVGGGQGQDTLRNIENITGSKFADSLTGDDKANTLTGGGGTDTLIGGGGADTLDGGTSGDDMSGGKGDDTYIVDDGNDTVSENHGEGTDSVQSSVTYTLDANVENLTLTGNNAINGTGNSLANTITGNDKANTLTGGGGVDTLIGGDGADTLDGGTSGDDMSGGKGDDSSTTDDAAGDTLVNIEEIQGSSKADVLIAKRSSNWSILKGGGGNDMIIWETSGTNYHAWGEGGFDTLVLDYAATVDLSSYTSKIKTIEKIEMGDVTPGNVQTNENMTLQIDADDVNAVASNRKLFIDGDSGDTLEFDDFAAWTRELVLINSEGNEVTSGGTAYTKYTSKTTAVTSTDPRVPSTPAQDVSVYAQEGVKIADGKGTYAEIYAGTSVAETKSYDGQTGNFYMYGLGGADTLTGSSGKDQIYGDDGNDILDGKGGNDILVGGNGNDNMTGGAGVDIFRYTASYADSTGAITGDLEAGGKDTTDATIGDILDFSASMEGYLKMGISNPVAALGSGHGGGTGRMGTSIGWQSNIALIDVNGDKQIHIDLDGDFSFDASKDFVIDVDDSVGSVIYNSTYDYFVLGS